MAERRFTVRIDAEMGIGQVKTAVQQMQAELSKLSLPQDMGSKISGTFSKLTNEIEKFQAMSAKGIGSTQDFNQLASSGNKIIQIYEQLTNQVKSLGNLSDSQLQKLFPPSILSNITKATSAMEQYQNSMKGSRGQITELEKEIEKAKNKTAQLISQKEKLEKKTAVSDTTFAQLSKDAEEAKRKFEEAQTKLTELQNQAKQKVDAVGSSSLARKSSTYRGLVDNDIPAQEAEVAKLEQAWNRVENKKNKALSQSQKDETIANLIKDIQNAEGNIDQLKNQLNQLKIGDGQSFQQLINQLNQINGIKLDPATATIKDAQQAISKLSAAELEKLRNSFSGFSASVESGRAPIQNFNSAIDGTRTKVEQLDQTMSEVDMLKSRVNYFFGLTNSVFLFKRAITSALNTVKELDAVMTETAVVTDFTIGDMWEKLPEYSDKASALGASIKDLYAATTLYYQQGLKTNEAMGVGVETMKMARIANMEASDATQAMTAALRGFNMEVNEMNAQKVNDVYSELAAITAADTSQIATAMSKTASIAASANMEFETTAALLAQIIETTQEAPETAGTAMKTIIARFTEVKKLFSEGQLTGEDEEGEAIEINKIDTALRSVGISLKDFLSGSKGIDDIFLELASKWNTLDLATQRYIATTAAGSRQQSRFIAMMSNYDRTMELVTAANNSAGASQEQFEKTLDSMEAKLQKLKNAWAEFTMGLANNEILKGGIDLITGLLKAINGLTEAISGGNGVVKSVLSLGVAFMGLKTGGAVLNGILASISQAQAGQGFNLGKNVKTGFTNAFAGLKNIQPNIPKIDFDTAGLKAYQTSLTSLQASLASVTAAEEACAIAKSTGLQIDTANVTMTSAVAAADRDLAAASTELATATGLSNVQAQDAVLMNAEGLSLDMAILAAKAGITSAEYSEMAAKMANAGATDAEVQAELRLMLAKKGVYIAQNQGIIGRLEEIVMTKLHTAAINGNIIAHKLEEAALKSKTAAMWVSLGVIGLIIAAVTLLTAGIVALYKHAQSTSLEGRIEAAAEATTKAKEAAEGAKSAYDELLNTKQQYSDLQETLDNLVAGTNEWKQALVDVNNQVLQLLKTYPELAEHISRGEDGQLVIDEEGWTELEDEREQAVYDSQQNYYAKQSDEVDLQIEGKTFTVSDNQADNYANEFFQSVHQARLRYQNSQGIYDSEGSASWTASNAEEIYNKIVGALEESPADEITLEKLGLEGQLDLDESQLKELVNYVSTKEAEIDALEVQRGLYAEEQLRLSGQQLNLNDKQMGMLEVVSQDYIDKVQEDLAEKILDDGITAEQKRQYANMKGYTYDEVADEFKDAEDNVIKVTNEMVASGIALTQALDNIAAEVGGIAGNFDDVEYDLLTNQGLGLTQDEINEIGPNGENLEKYFSFEESEDLAKYMGIEFETWGEAAYEEFLTMLQERVSANDQRFEEIRSNSYTQNAYGTITGAITNKNGSLDLAQAEALQQQIYDAQMAGMGNTLQLIYSEILGSEEITDEEIPKVLDKLLNIDPSNLTSVENALQNLVDQGIISAREVDSLVNTIADLAGVSRKVSFESMVKTLKTTEDLIEDIEGREDYERIFSTEDKEALVARGADVTQFVMTGADEWTYIGDGMGSLVDALNANTEALLGDTKETVMQEADAARAWQAGIENTNTWKVDGRTGVTAEEVFGMISSGEKSADSFSGEQLVAQMAAFGMSTEGLGSLTTQEQIDAATKIITEAYNKYGTSTQRDAIIAEEEGVNSQIAQLAMSGMTGQEIVSSTDYTDEEKQTSLDAKIFTEEGLQQELESSTEALEEQNKAWKNNSDVIKANIVDANTSKKKFDTLNETIEENSEVLSDSNKNTEAYQKALSNITKAAQEAFGNDEINEEFVEKHKELFQQLTEGGETGAKALQQIREAVIKETNMVGEKATAVEGILQGLDGLAFDVNGRADFSQLFTQLVNLMDSAEEAAALMSKLGYSVTWEQNGFTDMKVFNPETQEIEFVSVPNYTAVVTDSAGNSVNDYTPSGGGGGGGGGGSEETWENPYDKLYNLTREINEELRERERIERRYEKLLEKRLATAEQLSELSFSELDQLELEAELQREFISGRQQQIADLLAENPDMEQYFTVSTDENGEQIIRIDWDAINAVTDTEEGERIEENLGKVEDWSDDIEDANDTLNDIEDTVFEIKERGKDEYMDLEDQIKEALTQVYQDEIDKLSDINDSINDTNSRLLDAVQRSIDEQRQERENAKTEEELSDKRSRLVYLQQDTSGANALEILKLQEEIAQGEEDYTDSLIDQKISELQKQNDEAAAQREQQINIAQAQLDHYVETGAIWQEVYSLMTSGLNEKTGLIRGSRLEEVLQKTENFSGLSAIGKMEWLKDLETNIASALSYLRVGRQIEDLGITSGQISFTTKDGKTLTGTVDSSGNVTTSDGKVFDDVYQGSNGFYYSNKTEAEGTVKKPESPAPTTPVVTKKTNPYGNASETTGLIYEGMTGTQVKSIQWALKEMGYDIGAEGIDGVYGWATKRAVTQFQTDFHREYPNERMATPDGIVGPNTRNAFRIKQYKTGGLADFTGPAWLDGTKSRPEYILNADQTKAFFELVDVLSALKTNSSTTTQNSGDNTYDIDINVESIGSDYDVEQLANTVKRLINDDARYRNNNIAGHTR